MKEQRLEWNNPLVEQRADPWVLYENGFYYFIATVPEYDRIAMRRAESIGGLTDAEETTIWQEHEEGEMKHHIWAPELHRMNDKWYIYFAAAHSEDEWCIRMYVLECAEENPLTGQWSELGQIKTSWESFSLDATVMHYMDKHYLIWAQNDPEIGGNTNLYIDELTAPNKLAGKQAMICLPEYDWEVIGYRVNEGPAILIEGDKVYLAYSASKTDFNYCMGMLEMKVGDDPLNPDHWFKHSKPAFATSEVSKQFGPGHNAFVKTPDGEIVMIYHARQYKEIEGDPLRDPNRHARGQVVHVVDGELILGEPVPDGLYRGEQAKC